MDDIVVIILTIIIAVVGVIGQIKKKKQAQLSKSVAEPKSDNFWNLLEEDQEYSVVQEEEIFEPEKVQQEMTAEPEIVKSPSIKYDFTPENEGKSIYSNDLTKKQNEGKQKRKNILKDFSIKKAVIFSEILNRKYN